ncbi:MAG: amylosucrase [Lysobacter sp.]|nr:amylosucrase [Lysobacter sp.]
MRSSHRAQARARWDAHGTHLIATFASLYADTPRFEAALQRLLAGMAACNDARPDALRALDAARERDPDWFLAQDMIGYTAYADRFGVDLRGVAERVPYLQGLGIRYLHLLPFLHAREGDNDGGFAVRDYDAVEPSLGTDDDLDALTTALRDAGISLCADLVLNHTADDHHWALAALRGDPHYRAYYHRFADRALADAYERDLHQVFPQTAPGNFTYVPTLGWVWTTFYGYQWDLNWSNPDVFVEMALTMLRLANRGIEAFRLDSTAYLWKRLGTDCMNQPEAHAILQALRAVVDIVAPGVLLKAEAIVPARELPPYFGLSNDSGNGSGNDSAAGRECHLAYHSTLMAALWVALAEQRGDLLADVIAHTPTLPKASGWLTYLRCHDDIGWNVLREEARGGESHAPFDLARVARFYAGDTGDSFARGCSFQSAGGDHVHGTNGMASALAGIADAQARGDADALALAEQRLQLLYGIVFVTAGLPALYMGDEIALGNDEAYIDDPLRAAEGRWLHRPAMAWAKADAVDAGHDTETTAAHISSALRRMIAVRRASPALRGDAPMRALDFADTALLGIARGDDFIALFNLSARPVSATPPTAFVGSRWRDLLDDNKPAIALPIVLAPYALRWLRRE